jgi:hypothetical protein
MTGATSSQIVRKTTLARSLGDALKSAPSPVAGRPGDALGPGGTRCDRKAWVQQPLPEKNK